MVIYFRNGGNIHRNMHFCNLIFSILIACQNNEKVKALCEDVYFSHIGLNFPQSTIDFLRNKLSDDIEKETKEFITKIRTKIESQIDSLKSLPRLHELSVTMQKQNRISMEENKVMSKVMEKAQENALWNQLASNIPLKYGNSWFNYRDGEYCDPSKLSSFSQSYEIPRTEIYNPVSSSYEKLSFRLAKRGDQ